MQPGSAATHGYPCQGPLVWQNRYTELASSLELKASLVRCDGCGTLWERGENSARRMLPGGATTGFPDAELARFDIHHIDLADAPTRYWAHLNQGSVYRLYFETKRGGEPEIWSVVHAGELRPVASLDKGPLEECTRAEFIAMVAATHGPVTSAFVGIAIAAGLHPVILKALDLTTAWSQAPLVFDDSVPVDESTLAPLAASLLHPLVDAETVTPYDLWIEGLPADKPSNLS
jgi:hypothetical protein